MEAVGPTPDPILRTKLYRPRLGATMVHRNRLTELMDRALEVPLTLVCAPAGYGKSVLVSEWAEQHEDIVGWLSLDESDSEFRTFLEYLIAAIHTVSPGGCDKIRKLLQAHALLPVNVVAGNLMNELDALARPCILVLDDFHRIEQASPVYDFIASVLAHPAPTFHIVVISRRDPPLFLTSLRAGNRINEIRLQDLRFKGSEVAEFMDKTMGLTLGEDILTNLEHELEGWAVGLQLVALAARYIPDPHAFIRDLHGGWSHTREYLLREVLDAQTPSVQTYLLSSSILDRFCVELLGEIGDPAIDAAQAAVSAEYFVGELQRGGLFTIPLDARGEWFRYHHLFQDLLKNELRHRFGKDYVSDLRMRAGEWFEGKGLIDEALQYTLAAGNSEQAAAIVERNWHDMMAVGKWHVVHKWLSMLPDGIAQERPQLLVALAWKSYGQVDIETLSKILDRIEKLDENNEEAANYATEIALFRGCCAYFRNEGAASLRQIEYALDHLQSGNIAYRIQAEIMFGLAGYMEGQLERVTSQVTEWLRQPATHNTTRECSLLWILTVTKYMSADLQTVATCLPELRRACTSQDNDNFIAWCDYFEGLVHLQQGDLEKGVHYLESAAMRKYDHIARAAVDALGALTIAYQVKGQPEQAASTLKTFADYAAHLDNPFSDFANALAVRVDLISGRTERAIRWLNTASIPLPLGAMSWFIQPCITYCQAMIAAGSTENLVQAEERLREFAALHRAHHNNCQLINATALLAVACAKQGKKDEALCALDETLALAQPGGIIFPFLQLGLPMAELLGNLAEGRNTEFVERILSAFSDAEGRADNGEPTADRPLLQRFEARLVVPRTVTDPLTNREIDILQLLAQRLQDKEIASRMNISPHTVKDHLKHIYEKLDVHSRRQAVSRAAEFGFLRAS